MKENKAAKRGGGIRNEGKKAFVGRYGCGLGVEGATSCTDVRTADMEISLKSAANDCSGLNC